MGSQETLAGGIGIKQRVGGGVFGRGKSVGSAGKRGRVGAGRLQQVFCRVGDEWGIGSGGT